MFFWSRVGAEAYGASGVAVSKAGIGPETESSRRPTEGEVRVPGRRDPVSRVGHKHTRTHTRRLTSPRTGVTPHLDSTYSVNGPSQFLGPKVERRYRQNDTLKLVQKRERPGVRGVDLRFLNRSY